VEYITLTKADPEFGSYLLGTFSKTHRALPVETFHPQTARERVTFRLVEREKIDSPAWWIVYFRSCRPELLGLTMGPAIAAWLNHRDEISDWAKWPSWFALLGIFFLHTAAFLWNDVEDHVRGLDRESPRRGSQVIQRGWVSAAAMKKWALVNLALAVLFGVPAFLNAPFPLAFVCGAAILSLLALMFKTARWGFSDLALFLLFGPLLTAGIALASFGTVSWQDPILGTAFGALAVWVLQARQFENLFRSQPEGFRTFLAFWDFDRARTICIVEGVLLLILQPLVAWWLSIPLKLFIFLPLISIPSILFMGRLRSAASPLSSQLVNSDLWALGSHLSWTLWWVFALGVTWL
jgi:1,4-dihydroxy-2-naphthoate octaprenyltransferase